MALLAVATASLPLFGEIMVSYPVTPEQGREEIDPTLQKCQAGVTGHLETYLSCIVLADGMPRHGPRGADSAGP